MLHAKPGVPEGSRISFRGGGVSHVGLVRPKNEDAWAVYPETRMAVVADGMGGHPAGDVASRIAVEAVGQTSPTPGSADSGSDHHGPEDRDGSRGEWMAEAVLDAHRRVLEDATNHPERAGMGTTLMVLHVAPDGAWTIGHVGDSRAYLLRESEIRPLTRDQNPLREAIEAGQITREAARTHPLGHVLSQAVGSDLGIEPEILTGSARPGDRFLLCTDGITKVLSHTELAGILGDTGDDSVDGILADLVEATLARGAPDNVTAVLVDLGEAG